MILVVDNHDSFTWNLVHALARGGEPVEVVQSDEVSVRDVAERQPRGVVLAPGPGRPEDAGVSLALVKSLAGHVPLFGVCLGHQVVCAAFGATVRSAPRVMHGRTSEVIHDGRGVFEGLPSPLRVARYHSLIVDTATLPAALLPSAVTDEDELMAVRHVTWDIESVQFHPESFLTEHGLALVANWTKRLPRVAGDLCAQTGEPGPSLAARLASHG